MLLVGKLINGVLYRSLLKFDLTSIPSEASILTAELTLNMNFDFSDAGKITPITPYAVADSWDNTKVNWGNQPDINKDIAGTTTNVTKTGLYSWNVLNLVKAWHTESLANNGLELKTKENTSTEAKSFLSGNTPLQKPVLTIEYDTDPHPEDETSAKQDEASEDDEVSEQEEVSGHEDITTGDAVQYTMAINTFRKATVSFTINNTSTNSASIGIQHSKDDATYTEEFRIASLPKTVRTVHSDIDSKFKRISYQSVIPGRPATLSIDYTAKT
ncbi:hypothetical protein DCMF_08315 [Candidatus Formimonas warabiya]|uniref:DNRLRE domain-containing protein n=1 Tax=Formimonas warabiya TaxID=1761012 RepID=A0A3G1KQP0_FORW1|nr:hypothetical protein DCMF_08315 [Candidatus Formimonas warabiya]